LNGVSCSCLGGAKALFGRYVLRTDGVALYEAAGANGAQTPVLNAATGLPLADVIDVADGQYHGCAVVSGGSVWCWRTTSANGNRYGQVGNGTTDTSGAIFRATQVLTAVGTPLTNAKAMSIHANQSSPCAVMNDGKMYCWGALGWAVNNGTALYSGYAQAITTDGATPFTGVLQAANSAWQFCAVKSGASANEVWCWGYNAGNNLGLGDTTARHYPTKLVGLTKPSKVVVHQVASVSSGGACALDGANVRCWGNNSYGQIGNHTSTAVTGPTTVLVGDGATAFGQALDVFGGNANFCALRSGGTLWCWGNGFGNFAESYGVTNIVAGGWADDPRFLTSDGAYHIGALIRTPNCASL
jgi:alpha-tubulin suppressor-like RCC1 family protein